MNNKLSVFKIGFYEHSWRHPLESIGQFFRNCYYAWQRAVKGYCDWDLWDLDIFYRSLLIESLKDFKKKQCGYPSNMESEEEWNKYLDKMIKHFEESKTWWEKDDLVDEQIDDANAIIEFCTHERALEEEAKVHLKQGLEMLYEHFNSLWI